MHKTFLKNVFTLACEWNCSSNGLSLLENFKFRLEILVSSPGMIVESHINMIMIIWKPVSTTFPENRKLKKKIFQIHF